MAKVDLFKNPARTFRLVLAGVLLIVTVAVAMIWIMSASTDSAAHDAAEKAELALLAAEASDQFRVMTRITQDRIDAVLASREATGLGPAEQQALHQWLDGDTQDPPSDAVAGLPAPFSLTETVDFQRASDYLNEQKSLLLPGITDPAVLAANEQYSRQLDNTNEAYFQEPTLANLRDVNLGLRLALSLVEGQSSALTSEAIALRDDVSSSINLLRWTLSAVGIAGAAFVIVFAFLLSRSTQHLLQESRREQDELARTTEDLEYRNAQLSALYNVFNEITDTLSLRYVVKATITESLHIMRADMVVLRILRGDELEVLGAMTSAGREVEDLPSVKLGEGPAGRTVKRGRTLRVDEGGESAMAPPGPPEEGHEPPSARSGLAGPLESGLVVPLIVGARVVGTISCWSCYVGAFSDRDERVLEMMASQVATAIVAADATEKSERRALHDPLTSLPNRRQLDEDIEGRLKHFAEQGREAVIAMIDIDQFKRLNDDYGHRVGDVTLQKVASVLRSSAREDDLVYRYGGEEFVVVFSDTGSQDALALAERLRLAVEAAPLSGEHLDPVGPVTVSIGLALMPGHSTDLMELIGMADRAMYRAKADGRNRVVLWEDEASEASEAGAVA